MEAQGLNNRENLTFMIDLKSTVRKQRLLQEATGLSDSENPVLGLHTRSMKTSSMVG